MKGFKFLAILTFLISVGSLAGNWFLYQKAVQRDQLESQVVQLEDQIGQQKTLEKETDRLRIQVKDYANQRDAFKKELDQARKEAADLKKKLKDAESQQGALAEKMNLNEETDRAIAQEAVKLPSNGKSATGPLTVSLTSKSDSKKKNDSDKSAKTPETVVDQRPSQVLSVNRQFNFVVINLGMRDRVKVGDTLRVEQNGKLTGRIKVEKLYENFSACSILEEAAPNKINEGDLVRVA